jgi:hypothetical protein
MFSLIHCLNFPNPPPKKYHRDILLILEYLSVEASVIIIAACMPTLRPFFNKAFKHEQHPSEGKGLFQSLGYFMRLFSTRSFSQLKPSRNDTERANGDHSHESSKWKVQNQKTRTSNHSNSINSTGAIWRTTEIEMQSV